MNNKLKLNTKLVEVLLKPYNLSLLRQKSVKAGIENSSAFIYTKQGNFVLRVYQQGYKSRPDIKQELSFMGYLRNTDLPVPRIILNIQQQLVSSYRIKETTWNYIIMDLVPGRHLNASDFELIPQMAQVQALMHKKATTFARKRFIPKSYRKNLLGFLLNALKTQQTNNFVQEVKPIILDIISTVDHKLTTIEQLPGGLVHCDYDSDNIIIQKKSISGVIDFDDLANLPFVVDLANTLWWWCFMNQNKKPKLIFNSYLRHYSKIRKLSNKEMQLIPLFMRSRNIMVGIVSQNKRLNHSQLRRTNSYVKFDYLLKKF